MTISCYNRYLRTLPKKRKKMLLVITFVSLDMYLSTIHKPFTMSKNTTTRDTRALIIRLQYRFIFEKITIVSYFIQDEIFVPLPIPKVPYYGVKCMTYNQISLIRWVQP